MKLTIITGTCGAGKSSLRDQLSLILDPSRYLCVDTDELGINCWDYEDADHPEKFSDDCIAEAVRRAGDRDLVFVGCVNPYDYLGRHTIPSQVTSTEFVVLYATDETIIARLKSRPAERGFTTDEAIAPHVSYNQWFYRNRGKFPLFVDNTHLTLAETA